MAEDNNTRSFSYALPTYYDGATYPSTVASVEDNSGIVQNRKVFADANGEYFAIDNNGRAIPVSIGTAELPEVVVTAPRNVKAPTENMLSDSFNKYLTNYYTLSNDNTMTLNAPHREYNIHLKDRALNGAKSNALWEKEHPTLTKWGYALGAAPFAVASIPFVGGAAEYAAGTALGQGITNGLGYLANAASNSTWLPWLDAAATSYFGANGLQDVRNGNITPETAMDLMPLGRVGKSIYDTGKQLGKAAWYSPFAQYPRYYAGKIYYGNDVELPTLYRKIKAYPKTKEGKVLVTNPDSRFIFNNGKESPVITNMTTDVPVRAHSNGDWDMADTMVFPGKTLLGKHVISTRPSDTFTYGDNIAIDPSKVTFISGDKDAIAIAQEGGMKTITNDNLQKVIDDANRIEKLQDEGNIVLEKPDWDSYTDEMQKITRNAFKSPTVKDYKFMDWVFQPKYKSEVLPAMDLSKSSIEDLEVLPEFISSQLGNAKLRPYLLNPNEWRNVLYDPATPAEANFRSQRGIILKKDYYKKHPK